MKYIILLLFNWIVVLQITAQNVLKIEPGAELKTTGGVVITLQNMDLVNDGTINQLPGEGKFRFSGSVNNSISGANTPLFDVMEIAKTSSAKVSLQNNINIGSSINFTSGLIDLNNYNILMAPTALLNGESENSRIVGSTGGYIEIINTLNNPASVNPGNLGAVISSSANMGSTIIRRGHKSQVNGSGNGKSVLRYFDIIPVFNTALNASLQFNYFDAELNGLTENALVFLKSNNNTDWTLQGFTSRDVTANHVLKTAIPDFSRWTLSTADNALPVAFILFNVRCNDNKVLINWKTANEQNSRYFEVQRSENGINWSAIGQLTAAGNSSVEKTYFYNDNNPTGGTAYYRIAESDLDGKMMYTNVLKNICGQADVLKAWPNPVQRELLISINTKAVSVATIKVFDSRGAVVKRQQYALLQGNNLLSLKTDNLTPGAYYVLAEWAGGRSQQSVKFIKQ